MTKVKNSHEDHLSKILSDLLYPKTSVADNLLCVLECLHNLQPSNISKAHAVFYKVTKPIAYSSKSSIFSKLF